MSAPLPLLHCLSTKAKCMNAHPIIAHLQNIWKKVAGMTVFDLYLNGSASIWLNPKPCIGKQSFIWKVWVGSGVLTLEDLYCNNILKSFEDLKQQYNLPNTQNWRYFQLRHLLQTTFGSNL